jgi:hypothetical protein
MINSLASLFTERVPTDSFPRRPCRDASLKTLLATSPSRALPVRIAGDFAGNESLDSLVGARRRRLCRRASPKVTINHLFRVAAALIANRKWANFRPICAICSLQKRAHFQSALGGVHFMLTV